MPAPQNSGSTADYLTGTVSTVAPFTVLVDGASVAVPARRLASYTPASSERVVGVRYGTTLIVLGRLV